MTREEAIARWADIAKAVFVAEHNITEEWYIKLHRAKELPNDKQVEFMDEYLKAVAEEIVGKTSDEELKSMEE